MEMGMNQELMNVFGQPSGTQTFDQIKIAMEGIVVGDLIERAGREQLLPPGA